ncbi:MAG: cache domain-containing protein [Rhodospirillaceae bacterium]|nr:cache domain-containing protein [Rhodospirillales bacterium]
MKRIAVAMIGMFAILSAPALAADTGTADQAVALTKKAIAAIKAEGKEKVYAAINAKDPRFIDRDLYVFAYDLDANCLAHGSNPKMVGRNTLDTQDTDGKYYIKERMELGKAKPSFWQDYKFPNPVTKMIEPKSAYCENNDNNLVCVGVYK